MYRAKPLKKKIKMTALKSMAAIAVCLTFAYPLFIKNTERTAGYYKIELNGQVLGAAAEAETAAEALLQARQRITAEAGGLVYMLPELSVAEENKLFGVRLSEEELEERMYELLKENTILPKQEAYTVKINETTVYLSSKEEVMELLKAAKNRFDTEDEFEIVLVEDTDNHFTSLTTSMVKAGVSANEAAVVFAAQDEETLNGESDIVFEDGLVSVEFEQEVEIIESYVTGDQLTTVEEAYELLTKENEENQIYEVLAGDCMSVIAEKNELSTSKLYELNEGITENSILQIGQEIIITVPEPELSVVVKEEVTYEEDYNEDVVYIENDSWFTTEQVVQQEGTVGHREVVAIVNTRNGKETGRDIIKETIMVESQPTIIERGTITPPTYIKPLVGGTLTSYYGQRWGRLHAGIDWGVSTGTTIMASSGGTVVSAGWNGGYGYSILIRHPDGNQTRYAHLSKILVSVGEYVSQGERIAYSGNTGNSTGPHLHFEILVNGSAVNPLNYLN